MRCNCVLLAAKKILAAWCSS